VSEVFNIIRKALFEIAPFVVWIPIVAGLLSFKKAPVYVRLLIIHLFLAAIVQAIAYYLWKHSQNNLYLLHLYTVEELVMLTFFYGYLLKSSIGKNIFIVVAAFFITCAALNALFLQPITRHNTYARSLESLIIIIWTILYFYRHLAEDPDAPQKHGNGILLINTAFLLYFSASLLLFTLSNFISITSSKEMRVNLWAIHALVSIFMYILIAIGLWKHRKTAI
jgi:hypothetical protein